MALPETNREVAGETVLLRTNAVKTLGIIRPLGVAELGSAIDELVRAKGAQAEASKFVKLPRRLYALDSSCHKQVCNANWIAR